MIWACVIIVLIAAWFFSQWNAQKVLNGELKAYISELKKERDDLQTKLLAKHGFTPLGRETEKRDPKPQTTPQRVITRGELESRVMQDEERFEKAEPVSHVTIHANSVGNPKTRETIEKAAEILNK